jgi:hypothetical protein
MMWFSSEGVESQIIFWGIPARFERGSWGVVKRFLFGMPAEVGRLALGASFRLGPGIVLSHPCDNNKNVARMGHPEQACDLPGLKVET